MEVEKLHASGIKTVKVVQAPDRGCAIRPSDALVGKLTKGTAIDWVPRGHLKTDPTGDIVCDRWRISMSPVGEGHGGSMYSRANASREDEYCCRWKRVPEKDMDLPRLTGREFTLCGKVIAQPAL